MRRIPLFCYKNGMGTANAATPPLRVLVVDDEANIRKTLSVCLEAEGHRVAIRGWERQTTGIAAGEGPR